MRPRALPPAAIAALLLLARAAEAKPSFGLYRFDPQGKVRAVRAIDANGDGRLDLVAIVERPREGQTPATEILVLRTPAKPAGPAFYGDADVTRIPCDVPPRDGAGALALGRFGPKGEVWLDLLGSEHHPVAPSGADPPAGARGAAVPLPVPLGRSAGAPLVFWDGVADLDGDGRDEAWLPAVSEVTVEGKRSEASLAILKTSIPSRIAADVDGDGTKELLGLEGQDLVARRFSDAKVLTKVRLPFLEPDPTRPPEEIRTPRITIADADGDGKADLLVTLVAGRADKLGGLRTSLYHYAGPFVDPKTGALAEPRCRIDTESVALHPRFVDVDGDGRLDYVADSIRGTMFDLVRRVMGADPTVFYSVYRFVPAKGTFEPTAWVDVERPYSGAEARGNKFGLSGFLEGDFDGDGARDLLDLGALASVTVWKGAKRGDPFRETLLGPVKPAAGESFVADALVADLDGDKRSDAVLWTDKALYLVVPQGDR